MNKYVKCLFIFTAWIITSADVYAFNVGISPPQLRVTLGQGQSKVVPLYIVQEISDKDQIYSVSVGDDYLRVPSENYTIGKGKERGELSLTVDSKGLTAGEYQSEVIVQPQRQGVHDMSSGGVKVNARFLATVHLSVLASDSPLLPRDFSSKPEFQDDVLLYAATSTANNQVGSTALFTVQLRNTADFAITNIPLKMQVIRGKDIVVTRSQKIEQLNSGGESVETFEYQIPSYGKYEVRFSTGAQTQSVNFQLIAYHYLIAIGVFMALLTVVIFRFFYKSFSLSEGHP